MKSLKECKTIQEALPLIRGKPETFRTLVETGYTLIANPNPQQQAIGQSFLAKAIREMDDAEQPEIKHDNGIKSKGEKFVKEELLPDGNKSGNEGSEQSSGTKPTDEGTTEPDGDLESPGMSTENQMKEGFPPMPGMMMPGMDPSIAQQMAPQMGNMPPMNPAQQIQQMQYTVKEMMKPFLAKMKQQETQIKYQQEAIKSLNTKITETISLKNGLDLAGFKERQILPKTQETIPDTVHNLQGVKVHEKVATLESQRNKIIELDRLISSSQSNQPYQ